VNKNPKIIASIALAFVSLLILGAIFFIKNNVNFAPQSLPIQNKETSSSQVTIKGHMFNVEIAATKEKQEQGLSGKQFLAANSGMLFIFNAPDFYEFWMKGMLFPLDFVWINGNKIVDLTENVPRPINGGPVKIIKPKTKADKVLEINAGAINANGIKMGDDVEIAIP
jgi:hypothetical protein